jgi:hypothetical protein
VIPEGYRFVGWYESRDDGRVFVTDALLYRGTVEGRDLRMIACFEKVETVAYHTVTVQIPDGYQVLHEESGITHAETFTLELALGETFSLTIPWSADWALEGWYTVGKDGKIDSLISTDSIECFFTVTGDMTITPCFVPKYSLSVSVKEKIGSFLVDTDTTPYTNWGATDVAPYSYCLTAVEPAGYFFAGWYEEIEGDVILLSNDKVYTATIDGCDRVIYPLFEEATPVLFTVFIRDYMGGTLIANGEEVGAWGAEWELPMGSVVEVTVIPLPDHTFKGWYLMAEADTEYEFYSDELTVEVPLLGSNNIVLYAVIEGIPFEGGSEIN